MYSHILLLFQEMCQSALHTLDKRISPAHRFQSVRGNLKGNSFVAEVIIIDRTLLWTAAVVQLTLSWTGAHFCTRFETTEGQILISERIEVVFMETCVQ